MAQKGEEAVGSMGDDTPPPGMSMLPRPLFHYFKQRFASMKYLLKKVKHELEKNIAFTSWFFAYKYYVHRLLRL